MVPRILVVAGLWTSLWWSIVGALIAPVTPGGWRSVLVAALVAFAPLLVLLRGLSGAYPSASLRLWLFRPFWYVQLSLPLMAIAGAVGFLLGVPFGVGAVAGRWAMAVTAAMFAVLGVVGYSGSRQLRVPELDAHFSDLPPGLDGLRVVQISDVHVGPHTSRRQLTNIGRAVKQARADLIAFTGDHVDDYAHDIAHFAKAFGDLTAPLGVFAVAGNHDIYAGWGGVRAGLEAMGLTVLVNQAVEIARGGSRFWIAGTGDPAGIGRAPGTGGDAAPDIGRTLAQVPRGAFTLALAHNPALWPRLADRGVQLTLSGHTHHGQVSIPQLQWSLASLFLEYAMGWHRRGHSLLYINPGTNYWGLPLRIGALPEVTVLTLRRADGEEAGIRRRQSQRHKVTETQQVVFGST